ncbi:hypothetical protein AAFF_G00205950 [Aldrovandia affinis]|uniref:Optineurin n=1 Tax=Aldrovandia affinis TaxID=143900 RepID=A0AAD7W5C3_9TELE|nr:hypothetical protein AAFF_G00205950 [Aldrovandia affinis]
MDGSVATVTSLSADTEGDLEGQDVKTRNVSSHKPFVWTMASNPLVNGDISRGPRHQGPGEGGPSVPHVGALEDTLQQMNILIKENRELKEALKQTNNSMKERFEGLSAWKEKQKEERDFLEAKLDEAKERVATLTKRNEDLRKKLQSLEAAEGALQGEQQSSELKAGQGSPEDSFIEIRIAQEGKMDVTTDLPIRQDSHTARCDMTASRHDSEELTVSQLLQSLRKETQKTETLQLELLDAREVRPPVGRKPPLEQKSGTFSAAELISELEAQEVTQLETETQTSLVMGQIEGLTPAKGETPQGASAKQSDTEVEGLKGQMTRLIKELQQGQAKLDDAEDMKKCLHDRCKDMEQDLAVLRAQLVEKQQVQTENEKLKLQVDSMVSTSKMEQKKAEDERKNQAQLKEEYTKLYEDYNLLKQKKKEPVVSSDELIQLYARLDAAEQALAVKQQKIDEMKQDFYKKEQELDTISVFKAQAEVYSSDFYAERAAREKIHEERERLATQLDFVKKQNSQLQEELESLGRQSLNEMQRRHVSRGASPGGGPQGARGAEGRDWEKQLNIPEHACPKCNEILPDLDSLQIHIMDCII